MRLALKKECHSIKNYSKSTNLFLWISRTILDNFSPSSSNPWSTLSNKRTSVFLCGPNKKFDILEMESSYSEDIFVGIG